MRVARTRRPEEWRRASYWLATAAYCALGAALAYLVSKSVPYAAFVTGVTTDLSILGILARENGGTIVSATEETSHEEVGSKLRAQTRRVIEVLRSHAEYLRP
jgi:uncharacterized protein (DUF58 family)